MLDRHHRALELSAEASLITTTVYDMNCFLNSALSVVTLLLVRCMVRNGSMRLNEHLQQVRHSRVLLPDDVRRHPGVPAAASFESGQRALCIWDRRGWAGSAVHATFLLLAVLYAVRSAKSITPKQELWINISTHVGLLGYAAWCMATDIDDIALSSCESVLALEARDHCH